jgi:hypothetical protein
MNAVSLNNLWTYIQGLTLTASNRKWLADHLYESVKEESTLMSEEEFYGKLDRAEREIAEGKGTRFSNLEDMHAWLNSL